MKVAEAEAEAKAETEVGVVVIVERDTEVEAEAIWRKIVGNPRVIEVQSTKYGKRKRKKNIKNRKKNNFHTSLNKTREK